jgi:FkbM family methyltransferase
MISKDQVSRAFALLKHNPRLLAEALYAKAHLLLPLPRQSARRRVNGVWFEFPFECGDYVKAMYVGTFGIDVVGVFRKFLKPGDIVIDAGANIGYLSAVAAGLVGKTGQVHGFEPVERYYRHLERLAQLNPEYRIVANKCALGEKAGTATIAVSLVDPLWNSIVPGYTEDTPIETEEVPVMRLDAYLEQNGIGEVALIKLDTEGSELPILYGLESYLEKASRLPVVICEIQPRALKLLGLTAEDLRVFISRYGYRAFDMIDLKAEIDLAQLKGYTDVVFLPPELCA